MNKERQDTTVLHTSVYHPPSAASARHNQQGDGLSNLVSEGHSPMGGRRLKQKGMFGLFRIAVLVNGLALLIILAFLLFNGAGAINWTFLSEAPRDSMTKGGIFPCILGTFLLSFGAMIVAFPWGVASAIYLHEMQLRVPPFASYDWGSTTWPEFRRWFSDYSVWLFL